MADSSGRVGYLGRAEAIGCLAGKLGTAFEQECRRGIDPTSWNRHKPAFDQYSERLLQLCRDFPTPPDGAGAVHEIVLKAAGVARAIHSGTGKPGFVDHARYTDWFPDLNSIAQDLHFAIQAVRRNQESADPFAFLDGPPSRDLPRIDTTPAGLPRPPESFIEAAARAVPPIMANVTPGQSVSPKDDKRISVVASALTAALHQQGHSVQAACWAVHRLVCEGKLTTDRVYVRNPIVSSTTGSRGIPGLKADTRQTKVTDYGFSVMDIPEGKPAPFGAFRVVATESLWAWWHEIEAEGKTPPTDWPGTAGDLIERLLAGPDDVELIPTELARLAAELKRPLSLSTIQQEKRAGGQSETLAKRDKLTRILDFNRGLQATVNQAPAAEPMADADSGATEEATPPTPKAKKPKRSTERGEGRVKLIAALTTHHEYYNGSCGKLEPIGNNELARLAGVAKRTASAFFKEKFHGHTKYRALCNDAPRLVAALKALNGEFQPHEFYDARTPDEVEQEEE